MKQLLADPWIAQQVDAALAPYVGLLPPEELSWMREQLAEVLAADETAAELVRRARPRVVEESGEMACDPIAAESGPGDGGSGAEGPPDRAVGGARRT